MHMAIMAAARLPYSTRHGSFYHVQCRQVRFLLRPCRVAHHMLLALLKAVLLKARRYGYFLTDFLSLEDLLDTSDESLFRPHRICVAYRCDLYLAMFMVGRSVSHWSRRCIVAKRLDQSRCCLACGVRWACGARGQFTTGHGSLGRRCGLLSNYFDFLLHVSAITLNTFYINSFHHPNRLAIISVPVNTTSPSLCYRLRSCAKTS